MRQRGLIFFIIILVMGCQTIHQSRKEIHPQGAQRIMPGITEVMVKEISFDSQKGEIAYTLPEDAYVRIRVGLRNGGPLLMHLLDWELRTKGRHTENWDGTIQGSNIDFRGWGGLMAVIRAAKIDKTRMNDQGLPMMRRAPRIRVSFPESMGTNNMGLPIVNGLTPTRVIIDREDFKWLRDMRYEISLFIDNIYLIEEEEGLNPFTYHLNTKTFKDGLHTITVNISGYEGDAGTASAMIMINNN